MTDANNLVGMYIDRKADAARAKAKDDMRDLEFYNHIATVLEALADEIRMGLHEINVDIVD